MEIEFDPAKDEQNTAKHGISLIRAKDMEILSFAVDAREDYGETRFRAFGLIDGIAYSLAFAVRGSRLRAISLRRARAKELKRHVG